MGAQANEAARALRADRETPCVTLNSLLHGRGLRAVHPRVEARPPTAAAMEALAGRYHGDEVDMTFTVRVEEGKPRVRWQRQKGTVLEAVGGDRFVSDSLGTVTFTRARGGRVDGVLISPPRARGLRAERLAAPRATAGKAQGR